MKVALTGGTGFIGSYIAMELVSSGHEVKILARNADKVPFLHSVKGIEIVKAGMNDAEALTSAVSGCDALIHTALCWGDSGPEMILNETLASVKLLDIAVRSGIRNIIYTSSTAATGYSHLITSEKSMRIPEDFYGATKGSVELFCSAYSAKYSDLNLNIIRPGYTFGEPVVDGGSIENDKRFSDICSNIKNGSEIVFTKNDGTQFIHAADLAKIFRAVLESKKRNEIYFGLGSKFITWESIARTASVITSKPLMLKLEDKGYQDEPSLFDVSKIEKDFGLIFTPDTQIENHLNYLLNLS
ncbi:MAG TPA: NAD(P)-dependent oxidoreductase, partial [Spirochaetota bacterium]|nr:NAD(P)-dependent oxidoreductase [Spirochaetota bacterium]HQO23047.1 NAD(P)-dependent oxidoreductase [Spirochaetota bacterium]